MEEKINNHNFYIKSRDDFLKKVSKDYCKTCTAMKKAKLNIDYANPLNCECRCERVERILVIASTLDNEIKNFKAND